MSVGVVPVGAALVCLFFGDCESGSGALLGAQDASGGFWVGVCLLHAGFSELPRGVRGLAGMGV